MPTRTAGLLLADELDHVDRTSGLAESDLAALRAVASWVRSFVVEPHQDLGRAGPVCPFVPGALERRKLWFAPERIGDATVPDVVELMTGYRRRFLEAQPAGGEDAGHAAIIVVFTDLSAGRARELFADVLQRIAVPSYVEDGIVFGPFYDGHDGPAIHNSRFRPFRSPVPFVFVRHGVVEDWEFFLDDETWFPLYARRFGESAVHALAGELRRLPWRVTPG
jgi:hypothetical protein